MATAENCEKGTVKR